MRSRVWRMVTGAVVIIVAAILGLPVVAAAAQTHVVNPGDTLWAIARHYGVSVEALTAANRLANPDALQLGQQLIIPGAATRSLGAAARSSSSGPRTATLKHVVVPGDTLWSLARRYQVSVETIVEENRLDDPDALRLGQRLRIPIKQAARASDPRTSSAAQKPLGPGAAWRPLPTGAVPSRGVKWGSAVIASASRYVGVRYRWGGMSPRGFDCSGFIGYVMRAVGVSVPRTTYAMWVAGRPVSRDQLTVGDIVFFNTTRPGPSHAGIYIGNNRFIHASSGFGRVSVTSMDYRYYKPRYLGARRF